MASELFAALEDRNREGIYTIEKDGRVVTCTRNLVPGTNVYGERIYLGKDGHEYREWNPYRSKLSAYVVLGGRRFGFRKDSRVLYLGASSGTTVSHLSDIVTEGRIYAVEFSARSMRDLVQRLSGRENVVPILEDAMKPRNYRSLIPEQVNIVYQDVAQPEQARILIDNIKTFLEPGGAFYVAIKARSIDVAENPERVFEKEAAILEKNGLLIQDSRNIAPYSEDHVFIAGKFPG